MFADGANNQLLNFSCGHAVKLGGLVRLPLNERCGNIVTIADALFDCICRRHPVAAFIEDAAHHK